MKTKKPKSPTLAERAQELAWTLNNLLATLPSLDYATAPVERIEAIHAAQDVLKAHAALLAY